MNTRDSRIEELSLSSEPQSFYGQADTGTRKDDVAHDALPRTRLSEGFYFGKWTVIPKENCIRFKDRRVRLEPKIMQLLLALLTNRGAPRSRKELKTQVWSSSTTSDSTLSRAISELRKALGDRGKPPRYIETIQKFGYKAIAPIEPLANTGWHRDGKGENEASLSGDTSAFDDIPTRARHLLMRFNRRDIQLAVDMLQMQLVPRRDQAQVPALLAHAETMLSRYADASRAIHAQQALEYAEQALEIDSTCGLAWAVLGTLAHGQWSWFKALDYYGRAHSFQPMDPMVLHGYAELLLHLGRNEQAFTMMLRSSQRRPIAASTRLLLGWMFVYGEEASAWAELEKARRLGAEALFCDNLKCLLLHREGWSEAAKRRWSVLNRLHHGDPDWLWPGYFVEGLISDDASGAVAENVRKSVLRGHLDVGLSPFMLTLAGAIDGAFELAELAIEQRRLFAVDPWIDEMKPFRDDPRFAAVKCAVGFEDPQLH